jgi:hypothetical protein
MRTHLLLFLCAGCASIPEGRDQLGPPGATVGRASRVVDRAVWVERIDSGPFTRILARDGRGVREIVRLGAADRPVLSPDGGWVAFVYAPAGVAAIGLVPFEGGPPVQLTNVGVERHKHEPGVPPDGFVPVPHDDSLAFAGDRLVWDTPAGRQSVRVPR